MVHTSVKDPNVNDCDVSMYPGEDVGDTIMDLDMMELLPWTLMWMMELLL